MMRTCLLAVLLCGALAAPARGEEVGVSDLVEKADAGWERRAEKAVGGVANPKVIDTVLTTARKASTRDPLSTAAAWRVVRASFFRAVFCGSPLEERRALLEEARDFGEAHLTRLGGANARDLSTVLGRDRANPALAFWTAAAWGEWALAKGKLAAARQGAATRIRDLSTAVVAVDPELEEGGGHRILGRLHAETPTIPLLTGWVSRETAISALRESLKRCPESAVTRVFLAEALLEHEKNSAKEARKLLQSVVDTPPRPAYEVEETHYRKVAAEDLARLGK